METVAYVYKWVHIPTGKWYIGSRTRVGSHPNDGYYCSSKTVKPLILANPNEWKLKNSLANQKPKNKVSCPHCGAVGGEGIMKRWHFDNCKLKKENI
jgi:hypothetical protein